MPRRVSEQAVRYANATRAIFNCPHCNLETSYTEQEVSSDGIACRSCKRPFLPLVFYKDSLKCSCCNRTLESVFYREAATVLRLCEGCAAAFDAAVEEFERFRQQFLRGILADVRRKRMVERLAEQQSYPSCKADGWP